MTIKWRILLCVLLLQLASYGVLVWHSAQRAEAALTAARETQISALFARNLERINAQIAIIERSARDLAASGESYRALQQQVPATTLDTLIAQHLVSHFTRFEFALGGGLWFEPYQYDSKRRLFGPYAYRDAEQVRFTWDLNTTEYDYPTQSWYTQALATDWPRTQKLAKDVIWTEPYVDEAGSMALMMTADAPMYDPAGKLIGMATIDWGMDGMRRFIESTRLSAQSVPILLERQSGKFLSYPPDASRVMQPAGTLSWARAMLAEANALTLRTLNPVVIDERDYIGYYMAAEAGLVLGVLIPVDELQRDVRAMVLAGARQSAAIALLFMLVMAVALSLLFAPFTRVLALIAGSIHKDAEQLRLTPLAYRARNEFTPIVNALNAIYAQVDSYTNELRQQQRDYAALNASLEEKVEARTTELRVNNERLQVSLLELQRTQNQLLNAEKSAQVTRMLATIVHNVSEPLTAAIDTARRLRASIEQLLAQSENAAETARLRQSGMGLLRLEQQLHRVAERVRSFNRLTLDAGNEPCQRFDLSQFLAELSASLQAQLRPRGVQLHIACPATIALHSYPAALAQVLTQLVLRSLAQGYGPESVKGGHLQLIATVSAGTLTLIYADDGKPIPLNQQATLFTETSADGDDSLLRVQTLVTTTLKGSIRCESGPGLTSFILQLPLTAATTCAADAGPEQTLDGKAPPTDETV